MFLLLDSSLTGVFLAAFESKDEGSPFSLMWKGASIANARSSIALTSLLDSCFICTGKSWNEVEGVFLAVGPGSFTGVKIGLAFVQGALSLSQEEKLLKPYCTPIEALNELSGHQAILVPATKTNGFLIIKSEKVNLLSEVNFSDSGMKIIQKDLSEIQNYYAASHVPMSTDLSKYNVAVLSHWNTAMDFLDNNKIQCSAISTAEYLEYAASSVMRREQTSPLRNAEVLHFNPFYLKKSAPEERAQDVRETNL